MRGLRKQDVDELQRQIPSRDVVAEKQGKPVYHGSIEAAENALFPWLKARRRARADRQPSGVRRP